MIPYGRQEITQEDIKSVVEVLESDFLTQGPQVPNFEKDISSYCKAKYAVAVNSATSALHLACLSLGLKKGDWLWTSPITFAASANCGLYCGALIDFVDIDPNTYNMCPEALEKKLAKAEAVGKLPKVVIPVHLAGQSCDMKSIYKLSQRYGFKIIEDASHAIGGQYLSKPIGGCQYSDVTVFSFHPVKIITTGEGGMALTNDKGVFERMSLLRSHGITRDTGQMKEPVDEGWYYQQIELGYNYRITDIQAALGRSQFKKINQIISRRHEIADRYNKSLSDLPLKLPCKSNEWHSSAFHLYIIRLKNRSRRQQVFKSLRDKGVGVNLHYIPVYRHPYYQSMGFDSSAFPESESYYQEAITIPLHPAMSIQDQDMVVQSIKESL